jgi:hypothetical protein
MCADFNFTREEISTIEKNLGFIVFDWAKHLIGNIISQARNNNVKVVYINTPETLDAESINEGKTEYFYEKLPPLLGFKLEMANLRGREEKLWAYHLDGGSRDIAASVIKLLKTSKLISLDDIPPKYQGAFVGIIGRKLQYNEEEYGRVLDVLQKRKPKQKAAPKFYYDWGSSVWTGAQRFSKGVDENVVLQKITSDIQNRIQQSPALLKFWSFLLSQHQHFGPDVIGFALISKINQNEWVINEIQTDCINAYMKLRRVDKNFDTRENTITVETLIDMLQAQNRSKWIPKVNTSEDFRNQLLNNPSIIQQLPDDSQDIDQWIIDNTAQGQQGLDLMRHFQSVDFNRGIFRLY